MGFAAILGVNCYHIFGFAFIDDYPTPLLASSITENLLSLMLKT